MANITVLLVEDDPLYQELLHSLLSDDLGYAVVGPAATAAQARTLFREYYPDLALLDIHLPGQPDGIGLAAELLAERPLPLIFLSSLTDADTFRRARAVGPAAYLSKPTDALTLERTIELALQNFAATREARPDEPPLLAAEADPGLLLPEACFVRDRGRLVKVAYAEVCWVEAAGKYTDLHLASGLKHTVRYSLRELAAHLPTGQFVQVQRSFLVNVQCIEALDLVQGLIVVRGHQLPLGRAYREPLLARLRLL